MKKIIIFLLGIFLLFNNVPCNAEIKTEEDLKGVLNGIEVMIDYKEYSLACLLLSELSYKYPKNPDIYLLWGRAQEELGYLDAAYNTISKAIELSPKYYKAYNARGGVSERAGNYEKAIEDFDYIIKNAKSPDIESAYFNRAMSNLLLGKYQESLDDFNKYAEFEPEHKEQCYFYYYKGMTEYALEDIDSAKKNYNRANNMAPDINYQYYSRYWDKKKKMYKSLF